MRQLFLAVLVCLASAGLAVEERSILFIGNSLTIYNKLPQMFAGLAKAGGQGDIITDGQLVGGASLEKHWKDGKALEKLRSRAWTWVVLQEQSTATFKQPASFTTHARLFIEAIKAQKAKPVLYLTWARLGEMDIQEKITAALRLIDEADALFALRRQSPSQAARHLPGGLLLLRRAAGQGPGRSAGRRGQAEWRCGG